MPTKGEKTRSELITCARNLFYRQGYDATSFTNIVEASGLHRGNIYHYFKSKDEILEAVIDQRAQDIRSMLSYWTEHYATPKEGLLVFVAMVAGTKDLIEYGCPVGTLNSELGKNRREVQQTARAMFDLLRDWLTRQFAALGYEANAEAMALHFLGRVQGIAMMAQVYHDANLLKNETQFLREWVQQL